MGWERTFKEAPPIVDVGIYDATPVEIIEDHSEHGPTLKIIFKIITKNDFEGQKVSGICADKTINTSKIGKWIEAIRGNPPEGGEKIKDVDILHKPCQITVKHTEKNGTKFANVDEVLSASQKTDAPF